MSKQVSRIVPAGLALAGLVSLSQAQQQACVNALSDNANTQNCIQASTTPTMGMLYPISNELFMDPVTGHVGLGITTPAARLHVNGDAQVAGELRLGSDITFNDNRDGIQFTSVNAFFLPPVPMMQMFTGGTGNPDRMVIAHSNDFDDWGLEYRDAPDQFAFRSEYGDVLNIDLGGASGGAVYMEGQLFLNRTTYVDGPTGTHFIVEEGAELGIGTTGPRTPLDVNVNEAAAIFESTAIGPFLPVVQINGPSAGTYDFLLAGRPGANDREFRVSQNGTVYADGAYTGPADFAEMIQVSTGATSIEAGDLVEIDPFNPRSVRLTTKPRSTLVMGVYSTKPGFVGSEREWDEPDPSGSDHPLTLTRADMAERFDEVPVAVVGIVPVKASAENGPIAPGDLLVSSSIPGHVMRDTKPQAGTIVGKALGALNAKTGVIRILVTLQ